MTVEDFARKLSDAYSTGRYHNGWIPSIKALRRLKYSDKEIEAIIRSKWTRWAADESSERYGYVSAKTLVRYLNDPRNNCARKLPQLVRGEI